MSGRRPKPTRLKILAGMRPSRINRNEPTPPADLPPKPAHLAGIASREWDRLAEIAGPEGMRVLTVADGPMLEAAASSYGEYRAALAAIESDGAYYEAKTAAGAMMIRTHPAVAAAGDSWRRWTIALGHFGLSPATRCKVAKAPEPRGALGKYLLPDRAARSNHSGGGGRTMVPSRVLAALMDDPRDVLRGER